MTVLASGAHTLTPAEQAAYDRDGFLVREGVFSREELARISEASEALAKRIPAMARADKEVVGSYMFQRQDDLLLTVKWEPDAPELLQGLEPFAHLSPELRNWALDPRLIHPSKAMMGETEIVLWTEKLNFKRAQRGGKYILHQDHPYWRNINPVADRIVTAMIMLDDATTENGCLEVAPGSHKDGPQARRQVEGFGALEMDPDRFDQRRLIPVEVPAGGVIFFGPFLVHRSMPNLSDSDRRALLYSYQPAGYPHNSEVRARMAAERRQKA